MKKKRIIALLIAMISVTVICTPTLYAQNTKEQKMIDEANEAKQAFIKSDAGLADNFKSAYAYVIFPNIGKGALIVGGAGGKGTAFQNGKPVGKAKVVQITVGAQAGGQAYREVIFFENESSFQRFKDDKLEFSGQMSAVAVKAGASANVNYTNGVLVFTEERGGLMAELSVGGQKFTYEGWDK